MSSDASTISNPGGNSNYLPWLLAGLAAYIIYTGTPWGPGLTPDAVSYVRSVGMLRNGWQVLQLPSHFPPGFPLVLALGEHVFGDLMTAGRAVLAIAGAVSLLLFSRLLERCGLAKPMASLVALLLLVQPDFLDVHLMMWSEPVFLVLVLLDVLALHFLLRFPERQRYWLMLGAACGAAIVVRYAGIFLIPVNVASICLFSPANRDWRRRVFAAAVTAGISLVPLLIWFAFNHWRGASGTDRVLAWHPMGGLDFSDLAQTVSAWFGLPSQFGLPAALIILLVSLSNLTPSSLDDADATPMRRVVSLVVLLYTAFLWVSISLVDNYTPLDNRILFPVFPFCVASVAIFLKRGAWLPRLAVPVLAVPLIVAMCIGSYTGWKDWRYSRAEGNYLSNRGFQEMPVLKWLRSVPKRWIVLTNGPEIFEIYLQREAEMLPKKFSPESRLPEPDYPQSLRRAMARTDMIVYFQPMAARTYLTAPGELDGFAAFRRVYDANDAIVWTKIPVDSADHAEFASQKGKLKP